MKSNIKLSLKLSLIGVFMGIFLLIPTCSAYAFYSPYAQTIISGSVVSGSYNNLGFDDQTIMDVKSSNWWGGDLNLKFYYFNYIHPTSLMCNIDYMSWGHAFYIEVHYTDGTYTYDSLYGGNTQIPLDSSKYINYVQIYTVLTLGVVSIKIDQLVFNN